MSPDEEPKLKRVGAYAKLLANYASDDAIIDAGEAAELLFVRGLAFCATSDADGYITDAQVTRYVGAGMRDAMKRADRLAAAGLWARVDGGYMVRSWLKIHESSAAKGRRRKADRERKARAAEADSGDDSARNPDGIQTEGAPESLSLIQDSAKHDSTEQVDTSLVGQRSETLRAVPDTEPPQHPDDARCTDHTGVADPPNCRGCKAAREKAQRKWDTWSERQARKADERRLGCTRCDGTWEVDDQARLTGRKCDHNRRTA